MKTQASDEKVNTTQLKLEYIYFLIAAICLALIIWQHLGMNRTMDIYPRPDTKIFAKGDSINGGRSESTISNSDEGVTLHCQIRPSNTFSFCNLELLFAESDQKGINLSKYDELLLWVKHDSSIKDTMLIYLINRELKDGTKDEYISKHNMRTILPSNDKSFYHLAINDFFVPSWWILYNNAKGLNANPRLDNVISLSIATGDNDEVRSVDILLKKVKLTGKWVRAQNLYLFILLSWITIISLHASYRAYQLVIQLKFKKIQNSKLENINKFLNIKKTEFEQLAKTDPLTGIANRVGTSELLQKIQNEQDSECALIMFDIDHFKMINDTYGHGVGDNVLRALAKLISVVIRETDHFARWGGEEFIILCPNTNSLDAVDIANTLRQKLDGSILTKNISITCSFGVAQFQKEGSDNIEKMFESADSAMYRAKEMGRNRVEVYQSR